MKRKLRFAVLFTVALSAVPFLPLYIAPAMTRFQTTGGDIINWGLQFVALTSYFSDYQYFHGDFQRKEFVFWIAPNFLLALVYASLIAFGIDRIITPAARRD